MGKAMLAFLNNDEKNKILNRIALENTPGEAMDIESFLRELQEIWKTGYAINTVHVKNGVYAIAVPIFCHDGQPIAGMSLYVTVPANRISKSALSKIKHEYIPLLMEKGMQISLALGYVDGLHPAANE